MFRLHASFTIREQGDAGVVAMVRGRVTGPLQMIPVHCEVMWPATNGNTIARLGPAHSMHIDNDFVRRTDGRTRHVMRKHTNFVVVFPLINK